MGNFGVTAKDLNLALSLVRSGIFSRMQRSWRRTVKTSRVHKLPRNAAVVLQNQTDECDYEPSRFYLCLADVPLRSLRWDGFFLKTQTHAHARGEKNSETVKLARIWIVAIEFKTLASG